MSNSTSAVLFWKDSGRKPEGDNFTQSSPDIAASMIPRTKVGSNWGFFRAASWMARNSGAAFAKAFTAFWMRVWLIRTSGKLEPAGKGDLQFQTILSKLSLHLSSTTSPHLNRIQHKNQQCSQFHKKLERRKITGDPLSRKGIFQ